jgi:hypothetical protein
VFQPVPGIVCIQLGSLPAGGFGPKKTSTEPSAFTIKSLLWGLEGRGRGHTRWGSAGEGVQGQLRLERRRHRVGGPAKRHEERIALGVGLVPVPLLKGGTQEASLCVEYGGVPRTDVLEDPGRALDVGEEECHGSAGWLRHDPAPRGATGGNSRRRCHRSYSGGRCAVNDHAAGHTPRGALLSGVPGGLPIPSSVRGLTWTAR